MKIFPFFTLLLIALTTFSVKSETSVSEMAKEKGATQCYSQINLVAEHIIKNREHGSHATWFDGETNNHLFDSFTVLSYVDGDTHVSITAAPTSSGQCDVTYVETIVLSATCENARNSTFANWQSASKLHNKTVVLQNQDKSVTVYLTPQVNGAICMVTKRQTIFE